MIPAALAVRQEGEALTDALIRLLLAESLRRCQFNQKTAAEFLGISARELNYRVGKYGWRPKDKTDDIRPSPA